MHETRVEAEKALLYGILDKKETALDKIGLEELESLCENIGFSILSKEEIVVRDPSPATWIGSGKVEELKQTIENEGADIVVCDNVLSPRFQRNLEEAWGIPVMDREGVILRIFAMRAKTKEAKLQVELARLQYMKPRLTQMGAGYSQQRGGAYGSKGAGETQLELDQRKVEERILFLTKELKEVVKERDMQRQSRMRNPIPKAAIVGYTNSGKSTLLNTLTGSDILAENMLFATLDPTVRQGTLPDGESCLFTDTVGFISNLPTRLVDSFKSTLEEAAYADFLILLCDASHPDLYSCYETTKRILKDLGCDGKRTIVFINKMDMPHDDLAIARIKGQEGNVITGSIREGANLDLLEQAIEEEIHRLSPLFTYTIPETRYDLVAKIRRNAQVIKTDYTGEGIVIQVRIRDQALARELEEFRNK